jgi:hypothetical protein
MKKRILVMEFESFGKKLKNEIDALLAGEQSKATWSSVFFSPAIICKWGSSVDNATYTFTICISIEQKIITLISEKYGSYEEEEDKYTIVDVPYPESEEHYFQLSTVEDLGFDYEFYKYIIDAFDKLKLRKYHEQ